MGRRGPPPKPSKLKKAQGTYRKDRAPKNEVAPPPEVPDRPTWLDEEARAEWDRVVPQLADLGILAKVDRSMLANYCAAHSLAIKATRVYQREGLMIDTAQGPLKHPMINVAKEARAQARLLAAEFGLSAASRSRISVPEKPKEEDKTEDFLFGGKPRFAVVKGGADGA